MGVSKLLVVIMASLLYLPSLAFAASTSEAVPSSSTSVQPRVMPGVSAAPSMPPDSYFVPGSMPAASATSLVQQQLQLQAQELQLERQMLQIKQRLLQLQILQASQQKTSAATTSSLQWIDAKDGKVADKAIVAAYAKDKPLYICHADYANGTTHPGQVVDQGCLITYGGRALVQAKYQVLTGTQRIQWKPANALMSWQNPPYWREPIPLSMNLVSDVTQYTPVAGGLENDRTLYICRAMFGDQIHLGKVVRNNCNIGIDGSEVYVQTYEVLFA